jgi:hypothetical protein
MTAAAILTAVAGYLSGEDDAITAILRIAVAIVGIG